MANLLDQASIVLTPTAYNNGEALCVKPSDGSGDFDFSRNSAATRVNAQGLVENVQILSSNLVQNGDFSEEGVQEVSNGSFSQEGVELVTNGDFSVSTGWQGLNADRVISDGKLNISQVSGFAVVYQPETLTVGTYYKCVVEVSNYVDGSFKIGLAGSDAANSSPSINADGTFTFYLQRLSGGSNNVGFVINGLANLSIDNFSVREVGQDWTFTNWSLTTGNVLLADTGGYVYQSNVFEVGKSYKVSVNVKDYTSGNLRIDSNGANNWTPSGSNSVATIYISNLDKTYLLLEGTFRGSITNISVKEVGQNWALAGDFEVNNQEAYITNASQYSQLTNQIGVNYLLSGKKYKLEADIETLSISGALAYRYSGGAVTRIYTTDIINGKYTAYFTMPQNGYFWFQTTGSYTGLNATITNISVIEITDDTNLPRINYEGFSYQDALGSELVVNGGFDSDTAWTKGTTWSIGGGFASATENDGSYLYQTNICEIGKKYKFTFDVTESSGVQQCVSLFNVWYDTSALAVGSYSIIHTAVNTSGIRFRCKTGGTGSFAIDNVSVKEYLGQEVVPDSGCGSWLWEPQSTNLVTYSEDFSSGWLTNGTITPSYGVSPSGVNNSTRLQFSGANKYFVYAMSNLATFSIYIKGIDGETINIGVGNIAAGTLHTLDGNWQRVDIYDNSSSSYFTINTYNGTARDIEVWGAQLEQKSYATSYIPTSGSTVTRNQDVCNNGGSLASINSTEGVLYAEIAALADDGTFRVLGLSDGTSANRVYIGYSSANNITCSFQIASSVVYSFNFTSDIKVNLKLALKYKENDFALWVNGVKVNSQSSGNTFPIGTLTQMQFTSATIQSPFYGKTKALAVWKEALTDAELTELTTI